MGEVTIRKSSSMYSLKRDESIYGQLSTFNGALMNRVPIFESFTTATVLFVSICGFEDVSQRLTPEELVAFLQKVYVEWDQLVRKYQVEKIKAIGGTLLVRKGERRKKRTGRHDNYRAFQFFSSFFLSLL